ncbi:MAG TPA: RNA polymerase sigma factor [Xanthomonadaceae bacterium]|nr:RNA polymerase sigma factor [Xanthomonadaceae bacterium]
MSPPRDDIHQRLAALLAEFGARIRALIVSHGLVRRGLDADDIEQEVHIRLWRALERDRNGLFHASYIHRIVLTAVVDAMRRHSVRAADALPEDEDGHAAESLVDRLGPEQRAGESQRMAVLMRCLHELPPRRRQPVTLHLQGFGFPEIGRLVGVSAESARKLVSRGLEELKSTLREAGMDTGDE